MADETMGVAGMSESFITHMQRKVRRSQEMFPEDWRTRFTFYDGEVANLLEAVLVHSTVQQPAQADETITAERWAEIERVAAFGTPVDTLPSKSALTRMVEDLADEVRRLREAQANEPRAIIRAFGRAMERKLAANDGVKGGWRDTGVFALLDLMRHEISEFQVSMYQFVNAEDRDVADAELALLRQDVLDEAADVANYLMFACDVIGALPPTDERGR